MSPLVPLGDTPLVSRGNMQTDWQWVLRSSQVSPRQGSTMLPSEKQLLSESRESFPMALRVDTHRGLW